MHTTLPLEEHGQLTYFSTIQRKSDNDRNAFEKVMIIKKTQRGTYLISMKC